MIVFIVINDIIWLVLKGAVVACARVLVLLLVFVCSLPMQALTTDSAEDKKVYCLGWANRFLSIKDGANYMNNKISAAKFPKYVQLCLENYDELTNYYQKLKKESHMKSIK